MWADGPASVWVGSVSGGFCRVCIYRAPPPPTHTHTTFAYHPPHPQAAAGGGEKDKGGAAAAGGGGKGKGGAPAAKKQQQQQQPAKQQQQHLREWSESYGGAGTPQQPPAPQRWKPSPEPEHNAWDQGPPGGRLRGSPSMGGSETSSQVGI